MYDLHIHSLLSDGVLLPSEIARRYEEKGYKIIAITDHCDYSNLKTSLESIIDFCSHWPKNSQIKIIPGVELTHIPPEQFAPLTKLARKFGAKIVLGHGETPVEPVARGTNRAALLAGVDILAHPGAITEEDALLAKEKGIFLELTARHGHNEENNHVALIAQKVGANLILDNDAHKPEDIITPAELKNVALKAGLNEEQINQIYRIEEKFLEKLI